MSTFECTEATDSSAKEECFKIESPAQLDQDDKSVSKDLNESLKDREQTDNDETFRKEQITNPRGQSNNHEQGTFKSPIVFRKPDISTKVSSAMSKESPDKSPEVKEQNTLPYRDPVSKSREQIKNTSIQNSTQVPYNEPPWGGLCDGKYSFDILKSGKIIDSIDITPKTYYVVGRLRNCDIPMDHPSLSRYHAVFQYCSVEKGNRDIGWYLYDLGSTHGTWVNKRKVDPNIYVRLRVGYMIKFGGSTRLFILQGPSSDAERESELTITEMKQKLAREKLEAELLKQEEQNEPSKEKEDQNDTGCSWGMDALDSEDAEIDPDAPNPFALQATANEDLYLDDPKKTLRGYFEREGLDMPEYTATEVSYGKHKCTVELPIDDSSGLPITAEATVTGKKKESVIACALEACRILDRHGELRKATHESREKKKKDWEANDFYDSEEDEFLDRTGDIENKRRQRMKRVGRTHEAALSYDSIKSKLDEIEREMAGIESKLEEAKSQTKPLDADSGGLDALDAFMENIKGGAMDTKTKMALKRQVFDLKREQARLQKLADVARPASVPAIRPKTASILPMFGKRKIPSKSKLLAKQPPKPSVPAAKSYEEEEEEEDEEEENKKGNEGIEKAMSKFETNRTFEDKDGACCVEEGNKRNLKDVINKEHIAENTDSVKDPVISVQRTKSEECVAKETLDFQANNEMEVSEQSEHTKSVQKTSSSVELETENKTHLSDDKIESDSSDKAREHSESQQSSDSQCVSKDPAEVKVKGPKLPPQTQEKIEADKEASAGGGDSGSLVFEQEKAAPPAKKRRRERKRPVKPADTSSAYSSADPDYAVWLPPQNQSGDGTTHLNAKFGY